MVVRQVISGVRSRRRRGFALMDVMVGGVLMGIGLVAIVGLGERALRGQIRGEDMSRAALLLDELLAEVLMNGPDSYESRFPTSGTCESPYDGFDYELTIEDQGVGMPYVVNATVWWNDGLQTESVVTWMAARLGEEPDPERAPEERVER